MTEPTSRDAETPPLSVEQARQRVLWLTAMDGVIEDDAPLFLDEFEAAIRASATAEAQAELEVETELRLNAEGALTSAYNAFKAAEAERDQALAALMLEGHRCRPLARMVMGEARDWWLGELTEPLPDYPEERWCLHITTPLKSLVLGMNRGDWEQMAVLARVAVGPIAEVWIERMVGTLQKRALTPPTPAREQTED